MKTYRVLSISKNTNSFGLRGVILVASDGEAWEVASNAINLPAEGKTYNVVQGVDREPDFCQRGWEIPRRLGKAPQTIVDVAWSSAREPQSPAENSLART